MFATESLEELLRDTNAVLVECDERERTTEGCIHLIVVARFRTNSLKKKSGPSHPYLNNMPDKIKRHFHPAKMDRDRMELKYTDKIHNPYTNENINSSTDSVSLAISQIVSASGNAIILPIFTVPSNIGNDSILLLGRKLYTKTADFISRLSATKEYKGTVVNVSFLGMLCSPLLVVMPNSQCAKLRITLSHCI